MLERDRRRRRSHSRNHCAAHYHCRRSRANDHAAAEHCGALRNDGGDASHLDARYHLRPHGNRDPSDRPAGDQNASRHRGYRAHDPSIYVRDIRHRHVGEHASIHDHRIGHVDSLHICRTIAIRRNEDFSRP
jgi:hypothetical protein